MTCHCRFCGYSICYSRHEIGHETQCLRCGQSIRLPGKLAAIAVLQKARRNNWRGLGLEMIGFLLMFFLFPWGMITGIIFVIIGYRNAHLLVCGNCQAPVRDKRALVCPSCRSPFGRE